MAALLTSKRDESGDPYYGRILDPTGAHMERSDVGAGVVAREYIAR